MMDTSYEKLLESLARAEVKFIVVGGVAVALNGFVRTTDDVDIFTVMRGESYGDLAGDLRGTTINGMKIDFLSADGLIRLKADSTREKDQIDIAALRKQTVGGT